MKTSLIPYFRSLLFTVRVSGTSMMPELIPNHLYLATKLKTPKVGNNIVFSHEDKKYVKKVIARTRQGYKVAGTYSWSTSSKQLGIINNKKILGVIIK